MMRSELVQFLRWWETMSNLSQGLPFKTPRHTLTVTMDASMEGWGGHMEMTQSNQEALFSNEWSSRERLLHINLLELRVIRLTLQLLTQSVTGSAVRVECDNTTAIAYVNHQGGTHSWLLNEETALLYKWAVAN